MARVVITDSGGLDLTPGIAVLRSAGHDVEFLDLAPPGDLVGECEDADALIVSFCTIDAHTLAAAPRLRVIATTTTGLDQIDQDAATAAGVVLHPLPSLAAEEVATHALAGILTLLREIPAARAEAASWDPARIPLPPRASELTLGLLGYGQIGRALAERAQPLFATVFAHDPGFPPEFWPTGVEQLDKSDELFLLSDVVSLHAPATAQTHHLVNAHTLALMRTGSYLINVARGSLVDTPALVSAVDSGQLRGAFLDVLDHEPPSPDDPVLHHPRIIVTPHTAFASTATTRAYVMSAVQNVIDTLGVDVPDAVPPTDRSTGGPT